MSINHYVEENVKHYLDAFVNSVEIKNNWIYKDSDKAEGDNLVLNDDLVAEWAPVDGELTPYGNAMAVRIANQPLTFTAKPLIFRYLAPFSALYRFSDYNEDIVINQTGLYATFFNLSYNAGINYSMNIVIKKSEDNGLTYSDLPGSNMSSFPGTLVFQPNIDGPYKQATNICSVCVVNISVVRTRLKVYVSGYSNQTIDQSVSTFTILKL